MRYWNIIYKNLGELNPIYKLTYLVPFDAAANIECKEITGMVFTSPSSKRQFVMASLHDGSGQPEAHRIASHALE